MSTSGFEKCFDDYFQQIETVMGNMDMKQMFVDMGFNPSYNGRKATRGDIIFETADFVFASNDINYNIILEVDEDYNYDKHDSNYSPECEFEVARLSDLRDQYPGKPIFFIRYGVERVKTGEVSSKSKKKIKNCLETIFSLPVPGENELPLGYSIVYVGYTEDQISLLTRTHDIMQHEK